MKSKSNLHLVSVVSLFVCGFLTLSGVSRASEIIPLTMDFEDFDLGDAAPQLVARGWSPSKYGGGTAEIILDTTNKGTSKVLRVSSSGAFGWVYDLNGVFDPIIPWSYSADMKQPNNNATIMVDGDCFRDSFVHASNILSDGSYHYCRIEMDYAAEEIRAYADDIPIDPPAVWGNQLTPHFIYESDYYLGFYYWEGMSDVFYIDNIVFTPEPTCLLVLLLGGLALLRRRK